MTRAWIFVVLAACGRDHFDPAHNYAFVTSTVHDPLTFGGDFSGADAICAAAESDAGLLGSYVAYLGTRVVNAPTRLGNARGWVRLDGAPIVDRVEDLTAGAMFYPLRIDEHGEDVGDAAGPVATGVLPDGENDYDCLDWTTASNLYSSGRAHATTQDWAHYNQEPCASAARLYCFGTSYDAALEVTPAAGRRMFVSVQSFVAGGGLAAADALCASEASLAGVPGTFLALLPSSTASAASRFDLTGPPWVRLDGIAVADSPLAFMAGDLAAPPNVTSLGTYVSTQVMTAGVPANLADGGATCLDWTSLAASGPNFGRSSRASTEAFATQSGSCQGAPIYCLEP